MTSFKTISVRFLVMSSLCLSVSCGGQLDSAENSEADLSSESYGMDTYDNLKSLASKEDADELDLLINNLMYKSANAKDEDEVEEVGANLPTQPAEVMNTKQLEELKKAEEAKKQQAKKQEPAKQEPSKQEPAKQEPKKEEPKKSQTPVPQVKIPPKEDFEGPGTLKPTVYYFVVINEDKKSCDSKIGLHGAGGKKLISVCLRTHQACALQGSCGVVQNGRTYFFNIIGRFQNQERFFQIEEDGCKYGYGVNSSCLDPFYTLAADLTIYKPGEVIYIPSVVGMELPDGSKHSGYFVIRDQGRGIKGRGRFDFFSGEFYWADPQNPLYKIGFSDVKTNVPYYRVKGETAKAVLANRAYPNLPKHAVGLVK